MSFITRDDFVETYSIIKQRGIPFILSKLNFSAKKKTLSAFNELNVQKSDWTMIPQVQERWNRIITNKDNTIYEKYLSQKYLDPTKALHILSIGSGTCSHEIELAKHSPLWTITCTDIAANLFEEAHEDCAKFGITNLTTIVHDITKDPLEKNYYDAVLFHSSLHHFFNIEYLLRNKINPTLKENGLIIIHEYVGANRLQYPKHQIEAINKGLAVLPEEYKKIFRTNFSKKKITGPGLWRMKLADPTECAQSATIIPILNNMYTVLEEKAIGGNLLMLQLKNIAHHFFQETPESKKLLEQLFKFEDEYLKVNKSDFVFGVYRKKL
jgi:ubiquinone/menaquinone biosynthesis C-methylase UbiE